MRKLLFLAVLAGIAVAIKNALEDKGGSYEAPAAAQPSDAPVPTPRVPTSPVVTAEEIVDKRVVENLDEFADPAPEDAPKPRKRSNHAKPADSDPITEDEATRAVRDVPEKIDPFGTR